MSLHSGRRRLAAIMFTDIVNYTAMMGRDESAGRRARERHRRIVGSHVKVYGGELVDENGDELVVCFGSVVDAVNCALRVQEDLADDPELQIRAGIHVSDVVFEGGRLYGDGVNLAARVRAVADPGGICVTAEVWQAIRNQPNVEIEALGARELKNVDRPVALYVVGGSAAEPEKGRVSIAVGARKGWTSRLAAVVVGVLLVGAFSWWLIRPAGEAGLIRSIAVLPLENLSGDPAQDYFVDGMTDALILELARFGSLHVISRTSVMPYKATRQSLPEIAAELGVDALIEGAVTREGDRVRVTAQLIDGRSDVHLWADRFDRDLKDILALHSEIAVQIAGHVRARLTPEQERRLETRPPAVPGAHDEYLKGIYFAQKHTPAASLRARDHYNESMRLDPEYPLPYAGLADVLSCSPLHTWLIPAEGSEALPRAVMDQAHDLALRAVELDESLPEAQTALGLVHLFRHRDWEEAGRRIDRALALNPSYEFAQRSRAFIHAYQGSFDVAISAIERAREIDPFNPFVASLAGEIHAWSGDTETAMELFQEASALDAGHPIGFQGMGVALCKRGEVEAAEFHFATARELSGDDPLVIGDLGHCYASAGRSDEARSLLRELESRSDAAWVSPVSRALIHIGLGEREAALDQLERAYDLQAYRVFEIAVDDRWDPIRYDPRFAELVRRVGLDG